MGLEEGDVGVVPFGAWDGVAHVGVDYELFGRLDEVVACKVGVRGTGGVLQTNGHEHGHINHHGEVFDVEI